MNPPITGIPAPGLRQPVRIAHITDSHIGQFSQDDPRAVGMRERMEDLYGKFGRDYENRLAELFQRAADARADAIFMTGDLLDFPAPPSLDLARSLIKNSPCPVFFIPGNHDWNFPRQSPCTNVLRAAQRPLIASLFHDAVAVGHGASDIQGLQVLYIDNSTYQIDPEQLAFTRQRLLRGIPTALLIHIPITQPGLHGRTTAFWGQPILMGAEMEEEARRGWNVETPVPGTGEFIALLSATPHLRGIFSGHVHFGHEEPFSPTAAQYVGTPAFEGGIRFFEFQPA